MKMFSTDFWDCLTDSTAIYYCTPQFCETLCPQYLCDLDSDLRISKVANIDVLGDFAEIWHWVPERCQ